MTGERRVGRTQSFERLQIDPAINPAVLDTATWEPECAWQAILNVGDNWCFAQAALQTGCNWEGSSGVTLAAPSAVHRGAAEFCLAELPDGQQVFVEIGQGGGSQALGTPLGKMPLQIGTPVAAYPASASVIDRYCRLLAPEKGPRAMASVPRLGIGCRMTTAVWPAAFDAMQKHGFAANPIQNSVRELNLLDDLLAARPPDRNYACGFGMIEPGYTGSTYEGLWVAGTLAALKQQGRLNYGADADHLQVKRGAEGLARAQRLLRASRYYTFFTMDMADILHYEALAPGASGDFLDRSVSNAAERHAILNDHRAPCRIGGVTYRLADEQIGRFAAKYWDAFHALEALSGEISALKDGRSFDLELTIDEHPPEVGAFDCLTTEEELLFVLREIRRRGLPVTHVAPNYGAEKGWDYRGADGLEGLEWRVRALQAIAGDFRVMLDFHSADDLSAPTRAALRRATQGWLHYKISPMPHMLYAEVLQKYHPDLFLRWWNDALAYARREAENGSDFAAECVREYEASSDQTPSRRHAVFHHYGFAFIGRRDDHGQFLVRHEFYALSPEFYRAHRECLANYLGMLAEELFEE
ncbi:MAG: tagaturonate epimerase family protein [Terriglobia bacterium]